MIESIALSILGLSLAYLISEINQIQRDIRRLILDVAVLKATGISRRDEREQVDK
jgi:hypothetical protein